MKNNMKKDENSDLNTSFADSESEHKSAASLQRKNVMGKIPDSESENKLR